ncbi:hypothetical protein NDU88_011081 [Pleurodeles waltl]|uniref:Uncharacterized protein n=1 Tax=Pleurodeles waltl TaxID=8319 RepID=A0AAV7QW77_PLEWA|nr:hypothetical protein NDU88_011081 [Pleurodeles waltl]
MRLKEATAQQHEWPNLWSPCPLSRSPVLRASKGIPQSHTSGAAGRPMCAGVDPPLPHGVRRGRAPVLRSPRYWALRRNGRCSDSLAVGSSPAPSPLRSPTQPRAKRVSSTPVQRSPTSAFSLCRLPLAAVCPPTRTSTASRHHNQDSQGSGEVERCGAPTVW